MVRKGKYVQGAEWDVSLPRRTRDVANRRLRVLVDVVREKRESFHIRSCKFDVRHPVET